MKDWRRSLAVLLVVVATALAAVGVGLFAAESSSYGIALFVVAPFFLGFFPVAVLRWFGPRELGTCLGIGLLTAVLSLFGFLVFGLEGLFCLALAVPLVLPIVAVGSWAAYVLLHRQAWLRVSGAGLLCLVLLVGSLLFDARTIRDVPTFAVEDALAIDAPTDAVWLGIVRMSALPPPRHWLFRMGLACPVRTEIATPGVGGLRRCTLSTGPLLERITSWQPGTRLAWMGIYTPPPLREINPFRDVDPPHLHGLYQAVSGEFELRPLSAGRTLVIRRSTYRHNLYPAWYWKIFCDFAAHQGHRYVLDALAAELVRSKPTLATVANPSPSRAP